MFFLASLAFFLSFWQFSRATEKKEFLEKFDSRTKEAIKLDINTLSKEYLNSEYWDQRKVVASGYWIPNTTIYLDNRSFESQPGVHVVTAFKLGDKKSVVWINRGWAPKLPGKILNNQEFISGKNFLPPDSDILVDLEGIAHTNLMKRIELSSDSLILRNGSLWQNLEWNELHSLLKNSPDLYFDKIWPFILWQTTNSLDGLKRSLPKVKVDVNKHIGYAFQWLLLCFLALFFAWRIGRK